MYLYGDEAGTTISLPRTASITFPADAVWPTKPCSIAGVALQCPAKPKAVLDIVYGEGWKSADHELQDGEWVAKADAPQRYIKADMCCLAALYLKGGYYFDIGLQVQRLLRPVSPIPDAAATPNTPPPPPR